MKLVAIVGTNSDRSTNRKLLKFMQKHFSDKADIEVLEIKQLPAFNEPEDKLAPAEVQAFSEKILAATETMLWKLASNQSSSLKTNSKGKVATKTFDHNCQVLRTSTLVLPGLKGLSLLK